jgi:predicted nuclease of predicted toxin-antitoxin system
VQFLIDECLHTSLVAVAVDRGHQAHHVNWLGLSGTADWDLMGRIVDGDLTFVTNNAVDFRRLHGRVELHAGLIILLPQVPPDLQRRMFDALLETFEPEELLVNEAIEISIEDGEAMFERYTLPDNPA